MKTDEQLAFAAKAGDPAAQRELLDRYDRFLHHLARGFFVTSASPDDIAQEARIALMQAWKAFEPTGGRTFRGFVALVVGRQLGTYLKTARRVKHEQLTGAVRTVTGDDGEPLDIFDAIEAPHTDPVELLNHRDQVRTIVSAVRDRLTPLERESLIGLAFLDESYIETETRIRLDTEPRSVKVVDNALSRARSKLRAALEDDAAPLGAAA